MLASTLHWYLSRGVLFENRIQYLDYSLECSSSRSWSELRCHCTQNSNSAECDIFRIFSRWRLPWKRLGLLTVNYIWFTLPLLHRLAKRNEIPVDFQSQLYMKAKQYPCECFDGKENIIRIIQYASWCSRPSYEKSSDHFRVILSESIMVVRRFPELFTTTTPVIVHAVESVTVRSTFGASYWSGASSSFLLY